jgi:hypothetical protein
VDVLSDRRYVTLLLRIVADRRGRVLHGELVDLDGGTWTRFAERRGLIRALRAYLTKHAEPPGDKRQARS